MMAKNLPIEISWRKASFVDFEYEMRQKQDQKD